MTIVLIIPYKGPDEGKTRLVGLEPGDRRALSLRLVDRVVRAGQQAALVDHIVVVMTDPLMPLITGWDSVAVLEDPGLGLNGAVEEGLSWASQTGADAAIVIPSDLPFLRGEDIDEVASLLLITDEACGVVAPTKDGGTGALGLKPPTVIRPAFGTQSAARHGNLIQAAGLSLHWIYREELALDLDTSDDLALFGNQLLDIGRGPGG